MKRYDPKTIEPKWQKKWEDSGIYHADEDPSKPKRYVLEYFPYPSGAAMHVGHVRNYTIGDAIARFARMRGHNVLHPMGWDAFGLPAENYAIKNHVSPRKAIDENTARFKRQLMQMGFGYDWSREIDSTDPDYYKWTQWFFLLLFKRGLAYQKEALVNWDPIDKTVLANEQVIDGRADRSGAVVEKKALKQWFFKITEYADRLANDLDNVDWSDGIKQMQRNWIGRSKGAEVDFTVGDDKIKVFTTRPDTLFGATFMVLAPEHPLVSQITTAEHKANVNNYVKTAQIRSEIERQDESREKTGVFTGAYATNPANGEKIPIWIADYVLMGYGTGAIMAVPAHDQRDYEFATKYNLDITPVIEPQTGEVQGDETHKKGIIAIVHNSQTDEYLVLNWGPRQDRWGGNLFVGGGVDEGEDIEAAAKREIAEETGYTDLTLVKQSRTPGHSYYYSNVKDRNDHAYCTGLLFELNSDKQTETKLDEGERDKFVTMWVKAADVPKTLYIGGLHFWFFRELVLGEVYTQEGMMVNSGDYDGMSSSEARDKIVADLAKKGLAKGKINYKIRDWLISRQRYWGAPIPIIHCPKDGIVPVPEDQLPVKLPELTKFEPSGDGRSPLANVPEFVNTSCPKCGGLAERETDTMDGFACSSWYFLRFTDPHNSKAAFDKDKAEFWLPVDDYIGGAEHAVMHLLYARFWTKVMFDEGLVSFDEPFTTLRNQGMILAPDGQKMSKSKGNTIEPDGLIEQGYGADAIRIMELFIGSYNQMANWSVEGLGGSFRFLQRAWTVTQEYLTSTDNQQSPINSDLERATHQAIKKVSEDLHELGFNTAISALMEYTNTLYKIKAEAGFGAKNWRPALTTLAQLLAPFAPHIAEELWADLGGEGSVHMSPWPVHDEKLLAEDTVTIVVQVNGRVRATIELPAGSSEDEVAAAAKANDKVKVHLGDKPIKKTIYVTDRLINLVV